MALLFELVTSVVGLALKPVLLARQTCQFVARSILIIVQTWLELLRFALFLHFIILWRLIIWVIAVLSLPMRAFTALFRERMLEMQLYRLRNELENALWERNDLEDQLHVAINERRMMEMMLTELEEEHDEATAKLELLQSEVQDLKAEIQRLKEVQGKALWSYPGNNIARSSLEPYNPSQNIVQADKDLEKTRNDNVLKGGQNSRTYIGLFHPYNNTINILEEQREVALYRSLFSAVLCLIVGFTAWEADDPCIPLVVALFSVVALSLLSVLRLFTKIEHKPAFDAIALLSFNWFVLGVLMYPTLPRIGRVLAPLGVSFIRVTFKRIGV